MDIEGDLLPISALQHMLFCERQTALIHIERLWEENRFTAEGRVMHKKADAAKSETRDGIRITRSLPVHSFELRLYGVCDVVTFQPPEFETAPRMSLPKRIDAELARLTRASGEAAVQSHSMQASPLGRVKQSGFNNTAFHLWTITPVEYKRGKPKTNDCDRVQLCAQAMCLEEMLQVTIQHGDLFYGKQQHRTEVVLDDELRATTRQTTIRLHSLIQSQQTPHAVKEKKCDTCSLLQVCMPPTTKHKTASAYIQHIINE